MKERPIHFSGPMVRAVLEGQKTQTRRIVNPQPWGYEPSLNGRGLWEFCDDDEPDEKHHVFKCPYGMPGDRLWVRETWKYGWTPACGHGIFYRADEHFKCFNTDGYGDAYRTIVAKYGNDFRKEPWRPSIHMPRWGSRITLEVTGVRVERLQEITIGDIVAEGIDPSCDVAAERHNRVSGGAYVELWDSIYGKKHPWASNPWVWVIEFKKGDSG